MIDVLPEALAGLILFFVLACARGNSNQGARASRSDRKGPDVQIPVR
jgi:hypothetical protein